jgi:hypothetical protein
MERFINEHPIFWFGLFACACIIASYMEAIW